LRDYALNVANFNFVFEINISTIQMCKLRFGICEKLEKFGENLIESILAFGMYTA